MSADRAAAIPVDRRASLFYAVALTALRVMVGLIHLQHAFQKLFGWFPPPGNRPAGAAATLSLMWFVGLLEAVGGICVALGLFTRPLALLLSGEMAVAYFWRHAPNSFFPIVNRGEPALLLCFAYLFLAANGPGPWSLDALRGGERGRTT
jgi:putative oxidoreductase